MKSTPSLFYCIFMDLVGCATYLIPVVGEWVDMVWAPISAFVFYASFAGLTGRIGSLVNLIEELLPGLDFIPTFTLAYIYVRLRERRKKKVVGETL